MVTTDHKALVSLLKSRRLNKRLHGWILQLTDFNFEILYRPGKHNQDADGLSRQAWSSNEGDPCNVTMELEQKHPRTAAVLVGGDVGVSPT